MHDGIEQILPGKISKPGTYQQNHSTICLIWVKNQYYWIK